MRSPCGEPWVVPVKPRRDALLSMDRRVLERLRFGPLMEPDLMIMSRGVRAADVMAPLVRDERAVLRQTPAGEDFWLATEYGLTALAADRAAEAVWVGYDAGGPCLG